MKNLLSTCWMHIILQRCNNRTDLISTVHGLSYCMVNWKELCPIWTFHLYIIQVVISPSDQDFFFFSKCFIFYYFPFSLSILLKILVDYLFNMRTGMKIHNHVTRNYSVLPQTNGAELYIHIIRVDPVATADIYVEFGFGPRRVTSMVLASGQHN